MVTTLAGSANQTVVDGQGTNANFGTLSGMTVDPTTGNLYVAEVVTSRIKQITPAGLVTTVAGSSLGPANVDSVSCSFGSYSHLVADPRGIMYSFNVTWSLVVPWLHVMCFMWGGV